MVARMAENGDSTETEGQEDPFDPAGAHKVFSAEAFNSAWDLIEKADRTPEDDELMISLAHASAWHWTQREDVRNGVGAVAQPTTQEAAVHQTATTTDFTPTSSAT